MPTSPMTCRFRLCITIHVNVGPGIHACLTMGVPIIQVTRAYSLHMFDELASLRCTSRVCLSRVAAQVKLQRHCFTFLSLIKKKVGNFYTTLRYLITQGGRTSFYKHLAPTTVRTVGSPCTHVAQDDRHDLIEYSTDSETIGVNGTVAAESKAR
jgi:hypothetical protein